jgi:hypothetical protein
MPFLLLIGIAASLIAVGELSGEFGQIRQIASKPQNILSTTKGEFISLNNSVLFGFDVDGVGEDILKVKLGTNQTYSWHELIEKGKRIFRNENFTLDTTVCFFEIDVSVESYDKQTLQIIDNTKPKS